MIGSGCSSKSEPDSPVIAIIENQPVYMTELETVGRLAAAKANIPFDSVEGQKHFRDHAANLYKTLITIYVLKYTAEREGISPSPEELEIEFKRFKSNLQKQGVYEQFLSRMGMDEDSLRDSIRDHLAIKILQQQKLLDAEVEVSDQDIRDYYHKNLDKFRYPARMRASHILIKASKNDSPTQKEAARKRAQQIRSMIGRDPSKTFTGLARDYSEDQETAFRGGDIGFFDKEGAGIKAFIDAAFALKEGEVSDVVETEMGFHIIWATDHEQSLDEAYNQIKQLLQQHKKAEYFALWLEEATEQIDIKKLFDPVKFQVLENQDA